MAKANDQRPTTTNVHSRRSERGYILLMLMLFVTLLVIAAGALAPGIAFRVRRDREEEMIHRGVQYSRAIRRYVKKTGRYPSRLEDLENTNNVRFLRKRYKDPITGKDFKLLHVGEVQLTAAPGIAGASPIGNNPAAAAGALMGAASGMMGGAVAQAAAATPAAPAATDAGENSGQDANQANAASSDQSKQDTSQPGGGIGGNQLSSAVFGGGPIVGVASTSKTQSIREFNHKNHYNQWQFIYDPSMDRSNALITTPAQPALQVAAPLQQQNSSGPNSSGSPGAFGGMQNAQPSSFGGMQSSPPAQPTQPQQQQ
jgi:type II secretory pathway pseudopilin PulG